MSKQAQRILVVEDDEAIVMGLEENLKFAGYEVLTAFFLEASFLGIMLFGRSKVGPVLHFASTCIVAVGTLISAFWILAANSWMQTPAGYEIRDGVFHATDWLAVVFNPSFPYRFTHMVLAAYLTTSVVVASVAALHLLRGIRPAHARVMFRMAMGFLVVVVPLQILAGHEHGANVYEQQPVKLAAMEGHWETWEGGAPLILFALPNEANEDNDYALEVPGIGSWIVTGSFEGTIRGLKETPPEERPPILLALERSLDDSIGEVVPCMFARDKQTGIPRPRDGFEPVFDRLRAFRKRQLPHFDVVTAAPFPQTSVVGNGPLMPH